MAMMQIIEAIGDLFKNVESVVYLAHIRALMTVQHKNATNALVYVDTTSFTLLHSYVSQPSRGPLQGVLTKCLSTS